MQPGAARLLEFVETRATVYAVLRPFFRVSMTPGSESWRSKLPQSAILGSTPIA